MELERGTGCHGSSKRPIPNQARSVSQSAEVLLRGTAL